MCLNLHSNCPSIKSYNSWATSVNLTFRTSKGSKRAKEKERRVISERKNTNYQNVQASKGTHTTTTIASNLLRGQLRKNEDTNQRWIEKIRFNNFMLSKKHRNLLCIPITLWKHYLSKYWNSAHLWFDLFFFLKLQNISKATKFFQAWEILRWNLVKTQHVRRIQDSCDEIRNSIIRMTLNEFRMTKNLFSWLNSEPVTEFVISWLRLFSPRVMYASHENWKYTVTYWFSINQK